MTLTELNKTAFAKYLLSLESSVDAANHVLDCLKNGASDSMAWDLMEAAHGEDWKFPPEEFPKAIMKALYFLKIESLK